MDNRAGECDRTVLFTYHAKLNDLVPQLRARYVADTPVAVVCEASYPTQRIVWVTLETILERTASDKLPHLYLVYVGDNLKAPGTSPVVYNLHTENA